ncbi:MAG: hypothetical protein ACTTIM_05710 [Campylobacter sp.]
MLNVEIVLAIFGASNRGKTSIISKIYDIFTNISNTEILYTSKNSQTKDFLAIIKYYGKVIAFASSGDNEEIAKTNIEKIGKELLKLNISKIDYYICVTRTSGGSVKSINDITAKDIVWFDDMDLTYDTKIPNPNIIDLYIDFQAKRVLNHIK